MQKTPVGEKLSTLLGKSICSIYLEINVFIDHLRRKTLECANEINKVSDDSKLDGMKTVSRKIRIT